jgi:hypothetical protein
MPSTPVTISVVAAIGGTVAGSDVMIGDLGGAKDKLLVVPFSDYLKDLGKLGEVQSSIATRTRTACHQAATAALQQALGTTWTVVNDLVNPLASHHWDGGWKPCPAAGCPSITEGFLLKSSNQSVVDPLTIPFDNQSLECRYYIIVNYT